MSEELVRFEVWAEGFGWRASGRLYVFAGQTTAEKVGEAMRRLAAAGLLFTGDRFRVWVPGADGWSAAGELAKGAARELSLAAKISDSEATRH